MHAQTRRAQTRIILGRGGLPPPRLPAPPLPSPILLQPSPSLYLCTGYSLTWMPFSGPQAPSSDSSSSWKPPPTPSSPSPKALAGFCTNLHGPRGYFRPKDIKSQKHTQYDRRGPVTGGQGKSENRQGWRQPGTGVQREEHGCQQEGQRGVRGPMRRLL